MKSRDTCRISPSDLKTCPRVVWTNERPHRKTRTQASEGNIGNRRRVIVSFIGTSKLTSYVIFVWSQQSSFWSKISSRVSTWRCETKIEINEKIVLCFCKLKVRLNWLIHLVIGCTWNYAFFTLLEFLLLCTSFFFQSFNILEVITVLKTRLFILSLM
jgi:hypothetical protein